MTTVPRGRTRGERQLQTRGAAAGFHHDVVVPSGESRGKERGDAPGPGQGQVLRVVPRQVDFGAAQGQDPGDLQSQGTVAHHQDPGRGRHRRGFQDPEGCGQGFGKDRKDIGDCRVHGMEVGCRAGSGTGQRRRRRPEPQHPALPAVPGQAPAAEVAGPAANGDLPCHPLPQPGGVLRPSHLAHELMAHDPRKAVIALQDLQVGAADAGQMDAHQNLAGAWFGPGQLFDRRLSVKKKRQHKSYQPLSSQRAAKPRLVKHHPVARPGYEKFKVQGSKFKIFRRVRLTHHELMVTAGGDVPLYEPFMSSP